MCLGDYTEQRRAAWDRSDGFAKMPQPVRRPPFFFRLRLRYSWERGEWMVQGQPLGAVRAKIERAGVVYRNQWD